MLGGGRWEGDAERENGGLKKMKSHLEGGGFIGVVKEDMADET